jgi:antirestriction protein ArdC
MDKVERGRQLTERVDAFVSELEEQPSQGHTERFLEVLEWYNNHFHSFSLSNCFLIMSQLPHATQCAGYKQWSKMGCQVRKGESALWIRAPWLRKMTDQDTGEIEQKLVGYIAVAVFDISQVDGADNLPSHRHPLEGDYASLYTHALEQIRKQGIEVNERFISAHTHGISKGGVIEIHQPLSIGEKLLVLLHETAHEVLHKDETRKETPKRQRELEAEATSFLLAKSLGLDNPFSRDYITDYGGTVEGLQNSLTRIHRAVQSIYGWIEYEEEITALAAD